LQIGRKPLVVDGDRGGELVHLNLGTVALDPEDVLRVRARRSAVEVREGRDRMSRLEVRLSVQVLRLDKRHVLVLARRADEYVSGDALVVHDLDKVADA